MTSSTEVDSPPATDQVEVTASTVQLVIGEVTIEFDPVKPGGVYKLRAQLSRALGAEEKLLERYLAEDPLTDDDPPTLPSSIQAVSSRIVALNVLILGTSDPFVEVPTHLAVGG